MPIVAAGPIVPPPYDRIAVQRLQAGSASRRGNWFLDWFPGHGVIDGPEAEGRPFVICHLILLELERGMMLGTEISRLSTIWPDLQKLLLQSCARCGLPERLLVRRQDVAATLGPLAQGLDVELQCDDRLCVVTRQVHEGLRSFLAR